MKALILISTAFFCWSACSTRDGSATVAQVGSFRISQRDVAYRDQVIQILYPAEKNSHGLAQLKQAYTDAEILTRNGHVITPKVLDAEEARINENSRAPELLTQIKSLFGKDHEAYRRVYILPTYARRMIYFGFFLNDPGLQRESFERAKRFLTEALKTPSKLEKLAKQEKLGFNLAEVSLSEGLRKGPQSSQPQTELPESILSMQKQQRIEEAKQWIDTLLADLRPGRIYPQVLNNGETWLVVRYLRVLQGKHQLQMVDLPKADFSSWYEAEKSKIR